MKSNNIKNLTKKAFLGELDRDGSRIRNNACMWTAEWLKARGENRLANKFLKATKEFPAINEYDGARLALLEIEAAKAAVREAR